MSQESYMELILTKTPNGEERWKLLRDSYQILDNQSVEKKQEVLANGDGWDLGRTIAKNFRQKYNPISFKITDDTDDSDYPLKVSP